MLICFGTHCFALFSSQFLIVEGSVPGKISRKTSFPETSLLLIPCSKHFVHSALFSWDTDFSRQRSGLVQLCRNNSPPQFLCAHRPWLCISAADRVPRNPTSRNPMAFLFQYVLFLPVSDVFGATVVQSPHLWLQKSARETFYGHRVMLHSPAGRNKIPKLLSVFSECTFK